MFFKVKISMEEFEKNNTREKKISSEKKIKKEIWRTQEKSYLFIYYSESIWIPSVYFGEWARLARVLNSDRYDSWLLCRINYEYIIN